MKPDEKAGLSSRSFLRERTLSASRLLALYTALRYLVSHPRESNLNPEAMKDAATRSYHAGYREAQDKRRFEKPLARSQRARTTALPPPSSPANVLIHFHRPTPKP